jgi:hypothetical protein
VAKRALLASVAGALLLVSSGAATHSPWPDARHGWEVFCDRDGTCSLYSTEDGGRHWHMIFDGETDDVMGWLRTSARAGVLSINTKAPEQYWTRDNGRHWIFTRRLPAFWQGGLSLAGKGHFLFWSREHTLYQVVNWPPERRVALRLRVVSRMSNGSFADLAWIPRGVAAVVLRAPGLPTIPLVRVLLRRQKSYVVRLQDPDPATAARVSDLTLFASWPELTVLADDARGNPVYTWRSSDGGRSWRTPVR